MAPGATTGRGRPRENQFFNIGQEGRKTGITLKDLGERDEHGLEPMDNLFSSPEKPAEKSNSSRKNGSAKRADMTLSSSDMDIPDSTIPEPTEVRTGQKSVRNLPPPRSRSPIKTHLGSPPKKGHLFQTQSSPTGVPTPTHGRPKALARRLDFKTILPPSAERTPVKRTPTSKLANGTKTLQPALDVYGGDDEDDDDVQDGGDDSIQPVHYSDDIPSDAEPEAIEESINEPPSPEPPKATESATKRGRGRPPKNKSAEVLSNTRGTKRPSPELDEDAHDEKRQNTGEPPKVKRGRGRPPKNATEGHPKTIARSKIEPVRKPRPEISSPAEVKHMPPLPRRSRGLFIKRREDLADAPLTRSGRVSIKPLAYWKGETVEYEADEDSLAARRVIRVDEATPEKRRRGGPGRPRGRSKRAQSEDDSEEDADVEAWEIEPGRIHGDIRMWDAADMTGMEAEEEEAELALSAAAIITRDIPGSSFKFAKTLTLPFFGSGMVDLPPGGVKKMKNSRKMQMVFFVFEGRVKVVVNDNEFRIGRGGMWQVPRGNFYSIENTYERPARIFFAQGCEVEVPEELE